MSTSDFMTTWKENKKKYAAAQEAKRAAYREKFGSGGGGGGGKMPSPFSMRMRYGVVSEVAEKQRFLFNDPNNKFYKYYKTWIKIGNKPRTAICNCRQMEDPVPCVPCYTVANEGRGDLLPKPSNAITRVRLVDFHKVDVENPNTKKVYQKYIKCEGVDRYGNSKCKHCDDGVAKVHGKRDHISVSNRQMKQLISEVESLSENCASCGEGEIGIWGFSCPDCKEILASHKEGSLSPEEEDMFRNHEISCPHCDAENIRAVPEMECSVKKVVAGITKWEKGCDNPKPVDPWKMDIFLAKKDGTFIISDWSVPNDPEDMNKYDKEAFDFPYFFGGQDLQKQADALMVRNPFGEEDQKLVDAHRNAPNEEQKTNTETIPY